ncbi:MAG TPA: hypothetical protein VIJ14_07635, partial [Rhabdochlamydiaceae bacterium]
MSSLVAAAIIFAQGMQTFGPSEIPMTRAKKAFESKVCDEFITEADAFAKLPAELKEAGLKKAAKKVAECGADWEVEAPTPSFEHADKSVLDLAKAYEDARTAVRAQPGYSDYRDVRRELKTLVASPSAETEL